MDLAHQAFELASPVTVAGTEGGVLVAALTNSLPILFSEQRQCHTFPLEFLVHQRIVGLSKGWFAGVSLPVQQFLQSRIIQCFWNRPGQAGSAGQPQILGDHAFGNPERPVNALRTQASAVPVSQYVS